MAFEFRIVKVEINYFVSPSVVVPFLVMSADSDDSINFSGRESDLDFEYIFGKSSDNEDNFKGFLNQNIPAEIQWQWS